MHTHRSRCSTDRTNRHIQNFSIQAEKKIIEKSLLFSIIGKWLIGSRWGFLETISLNELRRRLTDTTHIVITIPDFRIQFTSVRLIVKTFIFLHRPLDMNCKQIEIHRNVILVIEAPPIMNLQNIPHSYDCSWILKSCCLEHRQAFILFNVR